MKPVQSTVQLLEKLFIGSSLGLAVILATFPGQSAVGQPITPSPNGTNTQVIINGNQFDIQGGALSADQLNLFHSFQQFGLTEGQIANFLANPNLRNIVTHVGGGNPSIINGLLQVSGGTPNFFFMNPSGIVFGPKAQLNLPASFSAVTADGIQFGDRWLNANGPNEYSALLGNPTAFRFSSNFAGAVVNAANLAVNSGSTLSLLGGTVVNTGQLTASQGQILITAVPGESLVKLTLPGHIINIEVDVPLVDGNAPQTWHLPITALPQLLTTGLTPELLGLTVTNTGQVQLPNGTTVPDRPGTAIVSGKVDVSGNVGGTVAVLGDRINLVGANLNASGDQGGGTILVGGDYKGEGNLPTARRTYVDTNTNLAADALQKGNGGRIIIWADETTDFYGNITAIGGTISGDGGFAEVSGQKNLSFFGSANLSSTKGRPGSLLLDPDNIVISNDPTIATISQSAVEAMSGNFDISFVATGNITIQSLAEQQDQNGKVREVLSFQGGDRNITFRAGGDINMSTSALLTAPSVAVPGSLSSTRTLTFEGSNITLGDISMRSGIPLNLDGSTGAPGGNVVIRSPGVIQTGYIATFGDSNIVNGVIITSNPYNGGDITITGITDNGNLILPSSIDINGQLTSSTSEGSGGNISIQARGNIKTALIGTSPVAGGNGTKAGNISIVSETGNIDVSRSAPSIVVPDLEETGLSAGFIAESGGNITIRADQGQVITSSVNSGALTNGGTVLISSPKIVVRGDISSSLGGSPGERSVNSGDIKLIGNVVLDNSTSITTRTVNGLAAGNILISGSINGSDTAVHSLTLDAGQGTVEISDFIGITNPIGDLTVNSQHTTLSGDIRTLDRPISFNSPIFLNSNAALTFNSGTAATTISGLNAGSTPLTLIADDVNFSGTLLGNSALTIQPSTPGRSITLGIAGANTLNLSPEELVALQGFSNVTISGGSGNIAVNAEVTLATPTHLSTTGNVNVNANITTLGQDLTLSKVQLGQDVTFSTGSGPGNINFLDTVSGPHSLTLDTGLGNLRFNGLVNVARLNIASAQTLFLGEGITTSNTPLTFNIPTVLTSNVALSTGSSGAGITFNNTLNSEAGERNNLNLTTGGGNIAFSGAVGTGANQQLGTINLNTFQNLTTAAVIQSIGLQGTGQGLVSLNQPLTIGNGGLALTTTGNIITSNITSTGGNVGLTSTDGNITTGNINTSTPTVGSNITLRSPTGSVNTGNLTTTGTAGGGNVSVIALDSITSREINTSATVGNGGNVLLDPLNDVQVSFISAQGGTNGAGGSVFIESITRFFRATGSFIDQNGINASISAAGGAGEGRITITHNGGDLFIPFDVFSATLNGTAGALTTGANNTIFPARSFPGRYTQGNIDIITSDRFTQSLNAALPDTQPEEIRPADTDNRPFWLDEYFTRRTEDYLGIGGETKVKSLEEIQDELQRIHDITGVKPALIYVVFEPEEVLRTITKDGRFNPEGMINQGSLMRFQELASDRIQLVLVTSEGQPILRRPDDPAATRANIPKTVEGFRKQLLADFGDYQKDGFTLEGRYLGLAQQLYQWLVKPLESDLKKLGIENLVFVMDAGLRSTPMAVLPALHDGQDFLVRKYSVGLMPSFSLTDTRLANIRNSKVLAMGMNDFSQYSGFNNLFAVEDEIRLITERLWPTTESDTTRLVNQYFTPDTLVQRRRNQPASIVHLATHTNFEAGAPESSFIIFFDKKLFFNEFRRLQLNDPPVELLVLSSCKTALSADDERAELGFAGLSVQAGAKSSLASLWEVSDVGTLGLMAEFYSQLKTAPIKAEALRRAQLAMIAGKVSLDGDNLLWSSGITRLSDPPKMPNTGSLPRHLLSHPGYWAGFAIVGNPW